MIIKILVNALAVFIAAYLLSGVEIKNFWSAVLTAILLAIVNALIRPLLIILTIPISILTLGLFILVIDALLLMLIDALLPGLKIKNFWWALVFSILLSVINSILSWVVL
jgi:putative membrane protein